MTDWDALAEDAPARLEREAIEAGATGWCITLAGGQFYAWHASDGMGGWVVPAAGDRLSLVRRPDNRHDGNAIEVWWRNEHKLGHLSRGVAAEPAPFLDAGQGVRTYIWAPGDGTPWTMRVLLVGPAVEAVKACRDARDARVAARYADEDARWAKAKAARDAEED